jgi:hypothetical protein
MVTKWNPLPIEEGGTDGTTPRSARRALGLEISTGGAANVNFLQSGTGAVARSVQSKERDAISVLDFAANGVSGVPVDPTGVVDSTLGIQAAITALGQGDTLEFAAGSYKITSELQLFNVNRVRLVGKGTVYIVWSAVSDATKACLKLKWAAHCEVVNINFIAADGTHKPGFGIYVTSEGSGGPNLSNFNQFIGCGATSASVAGIQIGHATVDADVNIDGNAVINSFIATCGTGIRVYGTNTNDTFIHRGSVGQCTSYGVELGLNARNVRIDNILLADNGTYNIHILKSIAGPVSIKNLIMELATGSTAMFLQVDPQAGGITTYPILSIENVSCTNNTTTPALKVIDYQGSGSVAMRNCRFAGGVSTSGGAGGTLSFRPPNAPSPGAMLLLTEGIHLYDGCTFDVDVSFGNLAFMRWIDVDTVFGGSAQGDAFTNTPAVRLNGGMQLEVRYLLPLTLAAGMTYNQVGLVSRQLLKITIDKTAWTAAALTQDLTLCTAPAKTRIVAAYCDTTIKYAGLAGTIAITVGSAAGNTDIILSHDVKTAAVTKGLADADMGASMTRAAKIQDAFVINFAGNTQPSIRLTSSVGNIGTGTVTNLTTGSTTIYLITETMP